MRTAQITRDIYELFRQHGSEMLWISDPIRYPRPRGTNEQTDELFDIITRAVEYLELTQNRNYSDELRGEYGNKAETLKPFFEADVWSCLVASVLE